MREINVTEIERKVDIVATPNIVEVKINRGTITGTPNRVARFSATNNLERSSLLFDDGTNIGVGATSTGGRFEIKAQGSLSSHILFRVIGSANQTLVESNGNGKFSDSGGNAIGAYSHSDSSGVSVGENSHADSSGISNAVSSHADSNGISNGDYSHADSYGNSVGQSSHADSYGVSNGIKSHADSGGTTTLLALTSHADSGGTSNGNSSHSDSGGTSNGLLSHADSNGASDGESSHADSVAQAIGKFSHADSVAISNGNSSHADSGGTTNGVYSNASGIGSTANSYSETSVGTNNEDITPQSATNWNGIDLAFSVGIGESESLRKTAFFVYKNGMVRFIARALSNITNAVLGSFAIDQFGRGYINNGSTWKAIAFRDDIVQSFVNAPEGSAGAIYYDTTTNKHYGHNGTNWNALY